MKIEIFASPINKITANNKKIEYFGRNKHSIAQLCHLISPRVQLILFNILIVNEKSVQMPFLILRTPWTKQKNRYEIVIKKDTNNKNLKETAETS